jgi:outer membrane protein assembly factor BamB
MRTARIRLTIMLATAAATAALALGVPAAGAAKVPGCAPPTTGGDWPFYSGTLDGHREQPAEQAITAANASKLAMSWKLAMPDGEVIQSTPTVADGCVFTGTSTGTVIAANADTGKTVWTQALGGGGGNAFVGAGIIGAPAIANGLVYVGVTTPEASTEVALDQRTGEIVWSRVVDDDSGGGADSSPVPFNGMVFQAFQGDESSAHSNPGFAILDGSRKGGGEILVKTHVIPAADYTAGDRGGSMVDTPAVDLKHKLVYAGTGNPASPRQNPITDSLIKIDANPKHATFGKILASQRGTSDSYPAPDDVSSPTCMTDVQWPAGRFSCAQLDYNFLASPNLFTDSSGRRLFGQMQKSGVFLTVDAETMAPVWRMTIGAPCFGCNLGSTATDAGAIYAATTGGNMYALSRDTGEIKWVAPLSGATHYNGVSVANGVVYDLNDLGALEAFDAADGKPLLAHPLATDTQTPMSDTGNSSGLSIARNTVFVSSQSNSTSTLFAFRLPSG